MTPNFETLLPTPLVILIITAMTMTAAMPFPRLVSQIQSCSFTYLHYNIPALSLLQERLFPDEEPEAITIFIKLFRFIPNDVLGLITLKPGQSQPYSVLYPNTSSILGRKKLSACIVKIVSPYTFQILIWELLRTADYENDKALADYLWILNPLAARVMESEKLEKSHFLNYFAPGGIIVHVLDFNQTFLNCLGCDPHNQELTLVPIPSKVNGHGTDAIRKLWIGLHGNMNQAYIYVHPTLRLQEGQPFSHDPIQRCIIVSGMEAIDMNACSLLTIVKKLNISYHRHPGTITHIQVYLNRISTRVNVEMFKKSHTKWIPFGSVQVKYTFITVVRNIKQLETEILVEGILKPFGWSIWLLLILTSLAGAAVFNTRRFLDNQSFFSKCLLVLQIVPFVFTRLGTADVLSCRQVCRKWCRPIDDFLEKHPQRRAYSHDGPQITGRLRIPQAFHEHYYLDQHFRGNIFKSRSNFAEFMQKMSDHPPGRNPFIGGYVKIEENGDCDSSPSLEMFWDECALEFVQKFGKHIRFLEIEFSLPWDDSEVPLEMLRCLPNLKGLTMSLQSEYDFCSDPENVQSLPFLPHLETLKLDNMVTPENMAHLYIPQHFATIRRLSIAHRNWRTEYSNLFPKLTELTIFDVTTKDEIWELLASLNAPDLYKLSVKSRTRWLPSIFFDENIVSWLERFPRIVSFKLAMPSIRTSHALNVTRDDISLNVTTLTSLTLNGMSRASLADFSVLSYFPGLEYFKVTGDSMKEKLDEKTVFSSDVWGYIPKLKYICVGNTDNASTARYSRARWEYLKKI